MDYRTNCCWKQPTVLGTCPACFEDCSDNKTLVDEKGSIYISDTDCERGKAIAKSFI